MNRYRRSGPNGTKTFRFCELLFNLVCLQKRQSIQQRYGKPKCKYEQAGSLIGLDVGIKTGVRGIGRHRASDLLFNLGVDGGITKFVDGGFL